jgi:ubiquinone/menaquinone biosynthesis C-methylase UbiE
MMTVPEKPAGKPNHVGVILDYVRRALTGQLHLPPWWLRDVGGSDFEATGNEFLELFIKIGQLKTNEQLLEIGCGSGRIALPLSRYLDHQGSYRGMDIRPEMISWCQRHLTPRYPNFQFFHSDLYNQRYNPSGSAQASTYTFPFAPAQFDFIFLTSVFTHLLPEDSENYLREIARMLRPQGRSLATFFLLNETQQQLAEQGANDIDFKYQVGPCRTRSEAVPESAIAYDETFLRQLLAKCGLEIYDRVYYGRWSGRTDGLSYQDLLLLRPVRA